MSNAAIGFIGVGTMGRPMAAAIRRAGFDLIVFDASAKAAADCGAETGARIAATPCEVARAARLVITMLPSGADVRAVALGADGLAEGFAPGSVLIDMSSSEPAGTAALAIELGKRQIGLVDAPVSGGRARAVDGTLTLMVGGADEAVASAMPVLKAMGKEIFRTGPAGTGHAMKAINNVLNANGLAAAAEALLVGRRFGLDPDIMVDVINASTGMNHATKNKMKQRVFSRSFDSGFALDLMLKDLDIALGLARETATPVPYTAHLRELWAAARAHLGPGQDHTAMVRWLEHVAKTELKKG